jgi:hypothetical protein
MDAEMDMDMPGLEELEWMESNGLIPEEEEETYFDDPNAGFFPTPGDSPPPQDAAALPAKPAGMHHPPSLDHSPSSRFVSAADGIDQLRWKSRYRKVVRSGLPLRRRWSRRGASG